MGKLYFTGKNIHSQKIFSVVHRNQTLKALPFVLLPLKFVKFETCYIKCVLPKL